MSSRRFGATGRFTASIVMLAMLIASVGLLASPAVGEASFDWEQVNADGFWVTDPITNNSATSMAVYNNRLYAGTYALLGCQVWRFDSGTDWTQIVGQDPIGTPGTGPGFGDSYNKTALSMAVADRLYVGTWNSKTGGEVWAYDGNGWTRVGNSGLGGGMDYTAVSGMAVLEGKIYAAVSDLPGGAATQARIYRYAGSDNWIQENNDGFGNPDNTTCRSLAVHGNTLYAGTGNNNTGFEIWRFDGPTKHDWTRIADSGFGNTENAEARSLASYDGKLYAGINGDTGSLYRYDGVGSWTRLFSAGADSLRTMVDYAGSLFLGFSDSTSLLEIWKYDGTNFAKISENGFGDPANVAVHSMVVYDGHLYCGTANTNTGCEVWRNRFPDNATWYLAEGSSAWGFSTLINVENPNPTEVTAVVTYMSTAAGVGVSGDGTLKSTEVKLPAESRTTISADEDLGYETDFSTRVLCLEGLPIAVDRTMVWQAADSQAAGYHNSIGVNSPAETWYLPEGSSAWGFECWTLIENPNGAEANVTLTYMIEGTGPVAFARKVPAHSRATYNMEWDIGKYDASIEVKSDIPVVPERAMYKYWTPPGSGVEYRREGHVSVGTATPANNFYLAEGTTAWGFTTYVLVQNPNKGQATIELTYMTPEGPIELYPMNIPPQSRRTIRVNDTVEYPTDLSTLVHSDRPIIAERAMYWATDPDAGEAMHDSIGVSAPHSTWYLPDGLTSSDDDGTETWTLVQNPNDSEVEILVSYFTTTGIGNVTFTDVIPASSRRTYNMADYLDEKSASIMVKCLTTDMKVITERAVYYQGRWGGTDTIGGYSD
ncbi:MAG: hypothetical protein JJE48_01590 [Actinobacteria bacterium]|nr:hypothetical protein [Actinomycetota bacterium]